MTHLMSPAFTLRKPIGRVRVNVAHPLNSGLLGWWLMNEGVGKYVNNIASSLYLGTFSGAPLWQTDQYGLNLYCDGADDYVSVAGGGGLNNLQTGSIVFEAKWIGLQDAGYSNSQYGAILSRQKSATFSNNIIGLGTNDPASAKVVWAPYVYGYILIGNIAVGDGVWRHVTVTFAPGDHRLYIDGEFDASVTNTGSVSDDSTIPMGIGAWYGDGAGYFKGNIRYMVVYNRILTPSEIRYLYRHPYGTPSNPRLLDAFS